MKLYKETGKTRNTMHAISFLFTFFKLQSLLSFEEFMSFANNEI